jgi:hypothetical protein
MYAFVIDGAQYKTSLPKKSLPFDTLGYHTVQFILYAPIGDECKSFELIAVKSEDGWASALNRTYKFVLAQRLIQSASM